ncbi:large with possible central conserved domain [Cryptosporidium xiaoi]|uniref:Large with possible central conserved domain n=1 Tax=Cryptosporidium xiaoi TaxID=659607 RepID=A0AAV9Y748_9CRYT
MLLPSINNKRIYDGIVKDDIVGIKISPCENFIAIVSSDSIQIVSNRRNRVLIARKFLDYVAIEGEKEEAVSFNGEIKWSGNSQLVVLGISSNKHVLIYDLNLTSPLDFLNESDHLRKDTTSLIDEENDDDSDYDGESDSDDNIDSEHFKNSDVYGKENKINNNEVELGNPELKKDNSNKKFFFLTEEIENGLIKVPSIRVPDEVLDTFQDELLSFQLISEYGTVVEKKVIEYSDCDIEDENQTKCSETSIEFSTSICRIKLLKVINLYYHYNSFELIYDNNIMDYVLLFTLYQYPILILTPILDSNKRKNILLNEFITFKDPTVGSDCTLDECEKFGNDNINLTLESAKKKPIDNFTFCSLTNSLIPVFSPNIIKNNSINSFLLESDNNNLSREIKLENMCRESTFRYIRDAIKTRNETFFLNKKTEYNSNSDYFDCYQSIIEYLITENSKYNIRDYIFEGDIYENIGISCVSYNINFDWVSFLVKPWNSLLLFSWKNHFSNTIPGNSLYHDLGSETNSTESSDMLIGMVLKTNGVIEYRIVEKNHQPLIISITNILSDYDSEFFNGMNKLECEIYSENNDDDDDCNYQSKCDNKYNFDYEKEDNNYLIEIYTLISNSGNIKIECIFNLELSKIIGGLTNKILSNTINLEVICNSNFIMLTLSKDGILVIDILTGKITFALSLCNQNKRSISNDIKSQVKNLNDEKNKSHCFSNYPFTIVNSKMISNDFGLLIQLKSQNHENGNSVDNNKLIEIPIYKLIGTNSTICSFENECDKLSCENLVFIGIDNICIAQSSSRNLNLELNSEDLDVRDYSLNCNSDTNFDISNSMHENKVRYLSSSSFCDKSDSFGITMSTCNVFTGDLLLESIQIPPSIYINHNWLINEAFISKNGDYLLISGFRGCALYDIKHSRWRLFCDVIHELLLCKPNLPFGWVTEHLFFLVVDSSLLLTTFHDLITSNDDLWEMSVFEKNLIYEKYINKLKNRLSIYNEFNENNCDLCIVFFDIRNSLDIKNIVGIIPYCPTPMLIVNGKKDTNGSFIVYYKNFSLLCYEFDLDNNDFAPTKTKWLIDLSFEWVYHPIDMLLIQENSNFTVILVLSSSYELYKLVIFHGNLEISLNKKCKYHLEPLLQDNIPFSIRYEEIKDDTVYVNKSNFETYRFNKILKYGYYFIPKYGLKIKQKIDDDSENTSKMNADDCIEELTNNFSDIIKLLKIEYKLEDNFEFKNMIFNDDLLEYLLDTIKPKIYSGDLPGSDKLKSYFYNSINSNLSGLIWYITQNNDIFVLPVSIENNYCDENHDGGCLTVNNASKMPPILIKSFNMNYSLVYVVNFIPQLGSLFVLESNSNIYIKEESENVISLINEFNKNFFRVKFTLNQIVSPVIQHIMINSNKTDKYLLIGKFIEPILKYLMFYPFDEIFNILTNIFENMVFDTLSNTCKEYKFLLREVASGIISYLNNNSLLTLNKNSKLEIINYYIIDLLQMYLSNIKLSQYESNDSKFGLFGVIIGTVLSQSQKFKELREIIEYITNILNIDNNYPNKQRVPFKLFSNFIISITRKMDSIISPCIVFPIVNLRPVEAFFNCLCNKDFKTAILYLTLLQTYYGPYSIRFEYSMILLHHILLDMNITNYDSHLKLSNNLIKFILIILKPSTVSLNIPLSKQRDNIRISIISEYYLSNNSDLNCIVFMNKIEGIIEYHFISKLINIEWLDLLIMCEYLNLNFNSWFSHCIQKYEYLWFNNESNIDSNNYHLSETFKNLVLVIQSKFNFFGIKQNTLCLLKEDSSSDLFNLKSGELITNNFDRMTPFNENEPGNFIYFESNSHKILNSNKYMSEFFFYNVVKRFFSAFLSNFKPIPALAIAHACNDVQSVHKILHDFPNSRMQNYLGI